MSLSDTLHTSVSEWRSHVSLVWVELYDTTLQELRSSIEGNPKQYEGKVSDFMANLSAAAGYLQYLKRAWNVKPSQPAEVARYNRYKASELRYQELLLPFLSEVKPKASLGFAPLLIVAGLLLGVGSIAWAIGPAYQYAVNLREQTALQVEELAARERASKEGRALQSSTLPPPSSPMSGRTLAMLFVLGGVTLLGYGYFQKGKDHESVH